MAVDPKTSRATLKSYFKKNAIPKERDFADLIDSLVHQTDDGIAKPDGEPLSLQPDARDGGDKKLVNFYKSFADPKPAWTLSLSPAGRPGWSLGDGDRNSKLFVEDGSGRVGLGTTAPVSLLHLRRDVAGGLGPVLSLGNGAGKPGAGAAIDFSGFDNPGQPGSVRLQSIDDGNFSSHLVISSRRPGARDNPLVEALRVGSGGNLQVAGSVGLGVAQPRSALDTGRGLLSGAANDYPKAQAALSGGGLVTWDGPGGYLKWTARFIAISVERGSSFGAGHMNIACPTLTTQVSSWDSTDRVHPTQGVLLKDWEALYAVHTVGGNENQVSFQVVTWNQAPFHAPGNWLLVAVVNGDDRTAKLGSGAVVAAAGSYAARHGSSLPKGAIIMWSGRDTPEGWALCDGSNDTPDLRGRFILGAGQGNGLSPRLAGQVGGEEKHKLSVEEMPSHTHGVNDPGHLHNWTASRQRAGVDDQNNTTEFSRGDNSTADTVSKNTDSRATGISLSVAGAGSPHENMPPYFVLAFLMKL